MGLNRDHLIKIQYNIIRSSTRFRSEHVIFIISTYFPHRPNWQSLKVVLIITEVKLIVFMGSTNSTSHNAYLVI